MLLETIFAPFVKERPICVMARAILERLLDAPRLDALFARTAQQQYTRELLFSSLVQLMSEVVLGVHPTVHAAYQANKDAIGVSTTALYNKLDRVETGVSAALVRDSAELAEPVVKALRASHPRWLPGYQIKVLDGNHLSSTEHRLKALRGTWAAPLPGQALVVLDQQRMLITDVFLSEDGHAQERSLIAQVLQHVREDQLWIEDRNFCTLGLMFGMARRGAAFVVRQHGQLQGELLGRPTRKGREPQWPGLRTTACSCETPLAARRCGCVASRSRSRSRLETVTANCTSSPMCRSNGPLPLNWRGSTVSGGASRRLFLRSPRPWRARSIPWAIPRRRCLPFAWRCWRTTRCHSSKPPCAVPMAVRRSMRRSPSYSLSLEIGRTYDGMMIAIPAPHWALLSRTL